MRISRDKYLNDLVARKGNGMVKVVTGARRCGKTYLLFDLFEDHLRAQGVDDDHIIEIALDDLMYERYRDPLALYDYVRSRITNREEPPRLYGMLNGLLRMRNVDVYVTGSNSKMLSTDVMTEFRGRGDEVRVRPLSFVEFMQAYDGDVQHGWAEYVMFGGMPLTLSMRSDEQKSLYLKNLFEETYLKDIVSRNGLRRSQELDDLVDVLASSIGALTNPPKIKATFASVLHSGISTHPIMQCIGHLEAAFVIEEARRFDVKGRKYIGSPKKYYFEDMGLRNARLGFRQIEQTHIMENIVYNELRTRGYNVDVGVVDRRGASEGVPYRKRLEVDFVANLGNRRCYIQSAYQLPTPEKVAQEKASLLEIDDSFQKIVLVCDVVKPVRDEHGILTMSVYDFLLDPDSLTM